MDRLIEKDALIVNESPTSKDILMANFQFSKSRSYFSNSSGGYLGWGLGAAIGAKLASRNRRVVACLGDGSTMFGLQGLWTLAKYRVPLTVIVFNNRAYMAVKNQFRGSEERVRIAAEMGAETGRTRFKFRPACRHLRHLRPTCRTTRRHRARAQARLGTKRTRPRRRRDRAKHQEGLAQNMRGASETRIPHHEGAKSTKVRSLTIIETLRVLRDLRGKYVFLFDLATQT